jgi:hypothetical protein
MDWRGKEREGKYLYLDKTQLSSFSAVNGRKRSPLVDNLGISD